MNPYTQDDTLQKIMNVVVQDVQIADKLKNKFKTIYGTDDVAEFLSETFLYCLQRKNKVVDNKVDFQDAPLLAEVSYECPLLHVKFVEEVKGVPKKNYEITQIFPDGISPELEEEFSRIQAKPSNLEAPSNLIALSVEASEKYLLKST